MDMLEGARARRGSGGAARDSSATSTDTVGRDASAVLLDPDVSVRHIVETGALGDGVGLIVRIEADGYVAASGLRQSQLIDGLGAAGALDRSADAAKVMVLRPPRPRGSRRPRR